MTITKYDISILPEIMSGSQGDWFTADLLRLMAKADLNNLRLLATVYPDVFVEFAMWKWQGIPYQFVSVVGVGLIMHKDAATDQKYRWLNPETGEAVKVELTHGRDF